VPAPIILSIAVLMTITAATSATCWTGVRQVRATRPSHVHPAGAATGALETAFGRRRRSLVPPSTWQACACKCSLAPGRANFELAWTRGEYPSLLAVEYKSPTAGGSYGATQ